MPLPGGGGVGFTKGHPCEDCGSELTYRDFYVYVCLGGAPLGSVPRCCEDCAESPEED